MSLERVAIAAALITLEYSCPVRLTEALSKANGKLLVTGGNRRRHGPPSCLYFFKDQASYRSTPED
jgi:hypothetical protein